MKKQLIVFTVCFFMLGTVRTQTLIEKGDFFQNFITSEVLISSEEITFLEKGRLRNDTLFFNEENIINISGDQKTPENLMNIIHQYLLDNVYDEMMKHFDSLKREEFIRDLKWKKEVLYLGILPIREDFQSYLFLVETHINKERKNHAEVFRDVLILNIRKDSLLSIVKICSYAYDWGDYILTYSIKYPDGYFSSILTLTANDVIYSKEDDVIQAREEIEEDTWVIAKFRINAQGFIELIED